MYNDITLLTNVFIVIEVKIHDNKTDLVLYCYYLQTSNAVSKTFECYSMYFDPSWTPSQRFNRVHWGDLLWRRYRFFGGYPRDSNMTSVSTLVRSLRMLSITLHRVGWEFPIRDRKPLFQDSQFHISGDLVIYLSSIS